ncbi:MAG: TonB-dependent receptor, partial [Bacteroidales bacterium]|nr:TonB-dependent receptor [Bacteroidales bacterium]
MNKSKQNKAKIFWFKKWSKKNYSIFASIGKQICISVLAFSYSLISLQGYSQKDKSTKTIIDSDTLPEVEINADENDILDLLNIEIQTITNLEGFSSASKTELPKLLPALEIRQRGSYGVQGDLQFRGGSPEQCLVLLNNIPINNAQTGHHNLNIPVPDIAINKVSIFSVGENIANIAGAYSGLLKYSTIKPKGNNIGLNLFSGSHKFLKAEILSNFEIKKLKNLISVAREQSSGYKANTDFKTTKLYYNSNLKIKKQKLEFEIGASKKEFGAQGFYSNAFPIQFEKIITSFSAINYQNYGKTPFQASIYWKRTYDRFELFRESFYAFENGFYIWDKDTARYSQSSFYEGHNYHLSDNLGASTLITKPIKHGKLITGFNYNFEHIFSNVLGNNLTVFKNNIFENSILFNKSAERHTSYGFISFDSKKHKKLKLNAQINALFYNIFPLINGGISLHYLPKNNLRLWLSANSSSRLPSFTELYYSTATNIGNASLKAETANNYELGKQFHYKNLEIQNRIFVIWGKNTIDWVRKPDETIYYAMNHT